MLSWAFIHTMFALHYTHEFYDESGKRGLAFPGGEEEPSSWHFVYFALVIGMTSKVSDVGVTSKKIRRTVSAHGVVSFCFNVALAALTVNIGASAILGLVTTASAARRASARSATASIPRFDFATRGST